jgi:hypothetical protein
MGELSKHHLNLILNTLESENKQLRQKLEAAEARVVDLEEVIASCQHLAASDMRKINELEAAIREAREQKPECWIWETGHHSGVYDFEEEAIDGSKNGEKIKPLYESPVPAMPIQDDKLEIVRKFLEQKDFRLIMFGDMWSVWKDVTGPERSAGYDSIVTNGKTLQQLIELAQSEVKPSC